MTTQPEPRFPLSRARILQAALDLADEHGIETLTMRELGQALGFEAMSLYNHVANKGDIVDAIVDRIVSEIELPSGTEDWETAIRTCAISAHQAFLRHPWACGLVMAPSISFTEPTARTRYIEWLLGRLREAGFSPELTYHGYHALDSHILGFTLWQLGHSPGTVKPEDMADFAAAFIRELPADEFPYLVEHIHQHLAPSGDEVSAFEFGLDLILDSLKRIQDMA
jgi:AcrR family transcriptional regulator